MHFWAPVPMILKNLACGLLLVAGVTSKGNMGIKLAGLCGASILLDISFLFLPFHSSKPSVSYGGPKFSCSLKNTFPPSKLTSRVLNCDHLYSSTMVAITKYHWLGGLNRNLLSHKVPKLLSYKISVSAELVPCEAVVDICSSPSLACAYSFVVHMVLFPVVLTCSSVCTCLCPRFPYIRTAVLLD